MSGDALSRVTDEPGRSPGARRRLALRGHGPGRLGAAAVTLSLLATLVPTTLVLAAPAVWTPTFTLVPAANDPTIDDLSAAGGNVAAAWTQWSGGIQEVLIRESVNSGTTWLPAVRLANNLTMSADEISVTSDAASGKHYAVWLEAITGGHLRIFMATKTFGSGAWTAPSLVSDNTGTTDAWGPSIAVTPAYLFLTYRQTLADGSNATARLRIFDRATASWGPSINLGTTKSSVSLAATSTTVTLVWNSNAAFAVRLRRGAIGSGTSPVISWSTTTLGNGGAPFIVLAGTRGVVGWVQSGDVFITRTTTAGLTWWAPVRVLDGSASQPYGLMDAAMSGQSVVFTGQHTTAISNIGSTGVGIRMTSSNGGATWLTTQSYPYLGDNRQVAFTIRPSVGSTTIAEAWTQILSAMDAGPDKVAYDRGT